MADESDEISLIDLVKAINRQRMLFFSTFALIVLIGIAVAFLKPRTYSYTSIYALSSSNIGIDKPLQNPVAMLALVKAVYLPDQTKRYVNASGEAKLPFKIKATNPASTALIVLQARTSVSYAAAAKAIQGATLKELESADGQWLVQRKKELTAQIDSLRAQLDALKGHSGNSMLIASDLANMANFRQQLASITPGQMVILAKRSIEPTGVHSTLIVVIAVLIGLLLALMSVFVTELAAAVKASNK